jgi:hypothetical protein
LKSDPNISCIHLRTLSTGEKHPLARSIGMVEYGLDIILSRSHTIRICGDYVGILFISGLRNYLVVWNWKTGVRELVSIVRTYITTGTPTDLLCR